MTIVEERLKEVRERFSLTQEEFASRLGVTRTAYAKYENGIVVPSDTFISLLCAKFHINKQWLCEGEGAMIHETSLDIVQRLEKEKKMTRDEAMLLMAFLSLPEVDRQEMLGFAEQVFKVYLLLKENANTI